MSAETPGGRLARRLARQRRRRRAMAAGTVALAAVAALAVVVPRLAGPAASPPADVAGDAAPPRPEQRTLLLMRAPQDGGPASGVTLLAAGPGEAEGTVVFLPVGTLMDVPGHGLDRLASAQQYGGAALVQATVENTLGIAVDHAATVSDAGLAALLGRIGTLRIDVPERLVTRDVPGEPSLRFAPGVQSLDGPRLAEYLAFRDRPDDELSAFPRQEQVWEAVFAELASPGGDERIEALAGDGAPQLDTAAGADWLRGLLATLARAAAEGELVQRLLPVEPFGGEGPDGGATYRLDQRAARALVADALDGSRAAAAPGGTEVLRVEVLNGVGTPGIGQAVHRRLQGGGFRIVRTDNARDFAFTETQILVYDDARLADARRLRDLLGVGTISVSRRPQSVVDLTVVVGADFAEREGRES